MLIKYIGLVIELSIRKGKIRLLSAMPLVKKLYRRGGDMRRILTLRSRVQQWVVRDLFGPGAAGIAFDSYNGLLIGPPGDAAINHSLGFNGNFNIGKIQYLLSLLDKRSCVYIIGAHIGTLAVPISKVVKEVVAFEANPLTFRYLRWNAGLNNLTNLQVYDCAIYDKETELPFLSEMANSGGSGIMPVGAAVAGAGKPGLIRVRTRVLDEFVSENGSPLPDLIIMDIEGAEYAALKGADACLQHARYLYIEYIADHLSKLDLVTVNDFTGLLTRYFSTMVVVDDCVRGRPARYSGGEILQKLTTLQRDRRGVDLLFSK
jgi:FkbM family methyltransferase